MKKNFKLILALVLSIMMVLGSVGAMAADTYAVATKTSTTSSLIITNSGKTEHKFQLYQIFVGDIDSTGVLSNIEWGNGVNDTYKSGKTARTEAEGLTAENVKNYASTLVSTGLVAATDANVKTATVAAGANFTFTGLNPGYYLVIDEANSQDDVEEGAYTAYILKVAGTVEATTKLDIPSVDKSVSDNDSKDKTTNGSSDTATIGGTTYNFYETADHEINEPFYFDLKVTIPGNANMAEYKEYAVTFKDTFSKGVTFEEITSVVISNDGKDYTLTEAPGATHGNTEYTKTLTQSTATTGGSFDLVIADILKVNSAIDLTKGTTIKVIYKAHLNENAIVTNAEGDYVVNDNKVYIEYSNEPNGDGKGKTKPDDVWVFTYELDNIKVASDKITEITDTAKITEVSALTYSESGYAKKDGVVYYKKTEGGTTKYYTVAMPDGTIKFSLTKSGASSAMTFKYDTTGKFYYPATGDGASADLIPRTDNNGIFNIHGLDEGTYTLSETAVPNGYNKASDITIVIKVDETTGHYEITTGDKAHVKLDNTNDDNIIINEKGATLPSTGGIGTTIFYVGGSILVLAAAILLITKRRMSNND